MHVICYAGRIATSAHALTLTSLVGYAGLVFARICLSPSSECRAPRQHCAPGGVVPLGRTYSTPTLTLGGIRTLIARVG